MKTADINTQRMMAHYVDQLYRLGYHDTDDMDYEDVKQKLAIARMKQIDYNSSENVWFE